MQVNVGGGVLKPDKVRQALIHEVIATFPTHKGEIGFKHGRLHSFRHFFVSQALLGGASEGEIRDWVGHRDSRIIARYRHLRHTDAQREMAQISFLGGGGAGHPGTAGAMKHNNGGSSGTVKEKDKTGAAGPPDVPEPRQSQNSSVASAAAQQEEFKANDGEQDGPIGGGMSQ